MGISPPIVHVATRFLQEIALFEKELTRFHSFLIDSESSRFRGLHSGGQKRLPSHVPSPPAILPPVIVHRCHHRHNLILVRPTLKG